MTGEKKDSERLGLVIVDKNWENGFHVEDCLGNNGGEKVQLAVERIEFENERN